MAVQPPPGLEAPQWNHVNNQNDVEVAMALLDRTSIPEKSPYAAMPRFIVTMEDAEIFAPSQLAKLQIVQNQIESTKPYNSSKFGAKSARQRRPRTATGVVGKLDRRRKERSRRVRPMTSTGVRRDRATTKAIKSMSKRPVSSPGNRKPLSRIAARKQSRDQVSQKSRMRNVSSAPLLGRDSSNMSKLKNNAADSDSNDAPLLKLEDSNKFGKLSPIKDEERVGDGKRKKKSRVMIPNPKFSRQEGQRDAARKIQSIQRGNVQRARVKKLRDEKMAAQNIQRICRGKLARKRVHRIQEEKQAAAHIQRISREMKKEKDAAEKIQKIARGNQARRRVDTMKSKKVDIWSKIWDEENQAYYYENNETGESRWEPPDEYVDKEHQLPAANNADDNNVDGDYFDEEEQYLKKEKELQSQTMPPLPPPTSSDTNGTDAEIQGTHLDDNIMGLGLQVMAKAEGWSDHYSGVISSVNQNGTYDVSFDDGDYQSNIAPDNIYEKISKVETAAHSTEVPQTFKVGDYVNATCDEWNEWYPGLIDSFDANAKTYCTESIGNPPSTNLHDDIQNEKSGLQNQLENLSSRDYDNHEFSSSNDPKTSTSVDNGSEQVSQNKRWFNPDEDEDESSDTSYSEDENEYGDDEFL
eukprot:g8054.t1